MKKSKFNLNYNESRVCTLIMFHNFFQVVNGFNGKSTIDEQTEIYWLDWQIYNENFPFDRRIMVSIPLRKAKSKKNWYSSHCHEYHTRCKIIKSLNWLKISMRLVNESFFRQYRRLWSVSRMYTWLLVNFLWNMRTVIWSFWNRRQRKTIKIVL